jgi:hypothetical protein
LAPPCAESGWPERREDDSLTDPHYYWEVSKI